MQNSLASSRKRDSLRAVNAEKSLSSNSKPHVSAKKDVLQQIRKLYRSSEVHPEDQNDSVCLTEEGLANDQQVCLMDEFM